MKKIEFLSKKKITNNLTGNTIFYILAFTINLKII